MKNSLHYNYVVFNMADGNKLKNNPDGYYTICVKDLFGMDGVKVVSMPLDQECLLVRLLFSIHTSAKIARYIKLPFKKCWYPRYFRNDFEDNKPLCFVIINNYISISYLEYLKQTYPTSKIVLLHRDLLAVSNRSNPELPFNKVLDLEMSIDDNECEEYDMVHFSEFESKTDVPISEDYPLSDVFFAGAEKGRLNKLITAYDIFAAQGIKCFFYITGVSKERQVQREGIVYADKFMPYSKMLYYTINSRCVLEFNYGAAVGYTSRFLEAVIYGKKLITDNIVIKNTSFFKSGHIQVIANANEIDTSFMTTGSDIVDYHYNREFSPIRLIEQIDSELTGRYGE